MKKSVGSLPRTGELFIREAMRPDYTPADPDNDLRKFMSLWLRTMPPEQLKRMDSAIVEYFGIAEDMPVDTALHSLRDMVNKAIGKDVVITATITSGSLAKTAWASWKGDQDIWFDALNAVIDKVSFRICEQCGKPFTYKREGAKLCSNACRVRSSRAKTG